MQDLVSHFLKTTVMRCFATTPFQIIAKTLYAKIRIKTWVNKRIIMMKKNSLLVLLGNQLFPASEIKEVGIRKIFMAEDFGLCTYQKHHKLKILMTLTAMRNKRDELREIGFDVHYTSIQDPLFVVNFETKLDKYLQTNKITEITMFEVPDKQFEKRLETYARERKIPLLFLPTPMFLMERYECVELMKKSKILRMGNFYKEVRTKFSILIDDESKPVGGKWSFDTDNRKKVPENFYIPPPFARKSEKDVSELKKIIKEKFGHHRGKLENFWMPTSRGEALESLAYFLEKKFKYFGTYEDAISTKDEFLFHSALSPALNIGLITPRDIIKKTLAFSEKNKIPINSVEGFLRQVIGWREFMRGVYHEYSDIQESSNFFGHSKKLKVTWYDGTTGIEPLDHAIKASIKYGYTHHINRLMVISNIMTLCEINPKKSYDWFMEMYVDAFDWVMTPNVLGMGTFADGGIFSSKPYICGSNYILKMSNYKRGSWCDTLDGLYWRFVEKNLDKLNKNPRLSLLKSSLNKMDLARKNKIYLMAEKFIDENCE